MSIFTVFSAFAGEYSLVIANETVNITGKPSSAITINGTIPGPVLNFKEGEDVTINVTNNMFEPTSIHWHGILLPGAMDGVPGFNGFAGIMPKQTFTYKFKIRQAGTYWYHAHSGAQEQQGVYGAIVVTPKIADKIKYDRDYVVLLSDFTDENPSVILNNLKTDSAYYNYSQPTVKDFANDINKNGFSSTWQDRKMWWQMRMSPADLSDVTGYSFLVNGKNNQKNWTGIFKKGERIKLRFVNASAMSIYDLRIPDLKMLVVAADGKNIEPVLVDELRFANAETYDVIVEPKEEKAYT
ncbi:MAG: multicopper oxidase domain-containing protein, partial [Pseudomonadota bacterium]